MTANDAREASPQTSERSPLQGVPPLDPNDPSLRLPSGPMVNRRLILILLVCFAALAIFAVAIGLSPHRATRRLLDRPTAPEGRAERPAVLTIGPSDYEAHAKEAPPASTVPSPEGPDYPRFERTSDGEEEDQSFERSGQERLPEAQTSTSSPAIPRAASSPRDSSQSSGLFFADTVSPVTAEESSSSTLQGGSSNPEALAVEAASESNYERQNLANEKSDFLASAPGETGASQPSFQPAPDPGHELLEGSTIQIALVTGINSDLPGPCIAQVTDNIYDSIFGTNLLIPAGSRLVGRYDHEVAFGQNRVLVAWDRLILPNGGSVALRGASGADAEGKSGFGDQVDYHFGGLLAGVGLATAVDVGSNAAVAALSGNQYVQSLASSSTTQGTSEANPAGTAEEVGGRYAEKLLDQQPTIVIRQGYRALVIVNHDLILPTYDGDDSSGAP